MARVFFLSGFAEFTSNLGFSYLGFVDFVPDFSVFDLDWILFVRGKNKN